MDIESILFYLALGLASLLIYFVIKLPRQSPIISIDPTSNIGKPSYWRNYRGLKIATLLVSSALLLILLIFLIIEQR